MIEIAPFEELIETQRRAAADIFVRALAPWPSAHQTLNEAKLEINSFLKNPERLALAALEENALRGWIGAIRNYDHGWELHPLVVDPDHARRGIGTQLVRALEEKARAQSVCTLYVGTDDEFGGTNIFGKDLYPNISAHMRNLAPAEGHPFVFYRKLGFSVVGLLPDVNGPGKPDIFMAKRIR